MSKVMEVLIKLNGQIDKRFPNGLKNLSEKTAELQDKMKKLRAVEKLAQNYEKEKTAYNKNLETLKKEQAQIARLQRLKNQGVKLSDKEEKKLRQLNSSAERLTRTVDKQRNTYEKYEHEIKKLGKPLEAYRNELKKTERQLKSFENRQKIVSKMNKFKTGMSTFGGKVVSKVAGVVKTGAAMAGAAAIYGGTASAQNYLEFDRNMKRVQAISGATKKEYEALEREALRLGATTKFTAGESAAAMEKMALAGFNAEQIIKGMGGVLDLAAAAGEDVAMVSDIITDNLLPFKMAAEDTRRFADVLSWGMSKTNVTVEMLGESFKYASGSAGNLGLSLEEMVGTLGLMGDQAIKSGMAGRGMNAVFSELVKKRDKLKNIGINISDSEGNFIGIAKTVELFEKVTKNMTSLDRVAFLKNVFGEQGERTFTKLLTTEKTINGITYKGAEAVAKTIEAATKDSVGMAGQMRDIMMQGASGSWELFTSAVDGLKNAVGKKIFNEQVLYQMSILTNYISELSNIINGSFNNTKANVFWQKFFINAKEVFTMIKKIVLTTYAVIKPIWNFINFIGIDTIAVFGATFIAITKVITAFKALKNAFLFIKAAGGIITVIKTAMLALGGPVTWIITGLVVGGYLIYKNFDKIKALFISLKNVFVGAWQVFTGVLAEIINGIKAAFNWFIEKGKVVFNFYKGFYTGILNAILHPMDTLKKSFSWLTDKVKNLKELIKLPKPPEWVIKIASKIVPDGSHKNGLDYVPFDNYMAILHKGERVLTADENKEYNQGSLFSMLQTSKKTSSGTSKNISINFSPVVNITAASNDVKSLSSTVEKELQKAKRELEEMLQRFLERGDDSVRTAF